MPGVQLLCKEGHPRQRPYQCLPHRDQVDRMLPYRVQQVGPAPGEHTAALGRQKTMVEEGDLQVKPTMSVRQIGYGMKATEK